MTNKIIEKIEEYNKIIILRHQRPDGDCIGASLGLREIIKNSYPKKEVKVFADDYAKDLNFIESEDENTDDNYNDALIIIVDTANLERVSNSISIDNNYVIKIDHHPNVQPYGMINYVEDELSSACELIVKIIEESQGKLLLNQKAAKLLYMGMVTDTGRFKYSVDEETLRRAGHLLSYGIDLELMYANLYLKDFNMYKLQGEVYRKMKISKNGVAYIYVTKEMQDKFGLTPNEASMVVGSLDSIKGSLIWIAFIDNADGSIRVRLRSRFLEINDIASKYRGGGHSRASGATLYEKEEIKKLVNDCDKKLKKFKDEKTGWL